MEIASVTDSIESKDVLTNVSSEWNGKDVQPLPKCHAWLVLKIPIETPSYIPSLGQRITSVSPTVEDVLHRHGLEFWTDRTVMQMPTDDHFFVTIPLQPENSSCLQERVTLDTNDYRNIERVLERQGLQTPFPPFFSNQTLV